MSIYDKKGFQMVTTIHDKVSLEHKERRVFDPANNKVVKRMVEITNVQNTYNNIMGYVDLDDLISWYYGVHSFREHKYWVPVYLWIVRKRADLAYHLYLMRVGEAIQRLQAQLDGVTSSQRRIALQDELTDLRRGVVSHFAFLEEICAYHIVKGYNSSVCPSAALAGPSEWRTAIAAGRRTNAVVPRSSARPLSRPPPSRKRARKYGSDQDEWPASRLVGKHELGSHGSCKVAHFCDLPTCVLMRPKHRMPSPPPRRGRGRGRGGAETPSPVPYVTVDGSGGNFRARTTLYCKECKDASGVRNLNFHPECWNIWHGHGIHGVLEDVESGPLVNEADVDYVVSASSSTLL